MNEPAMSDVIIAIRERFLEREEPTDMNDQAEAPRRAFVRSDMSINGAKVVRGEVIDLRGTPAEEKLLALNTGSFPVRYLLEYPGPFDVCPAEGCKRKFADQQTLEVKHVRIEHPELASVVPPPPGELLFAIPTRQFQHRGQPVGGSYPMLPEVIQVSEEEFGQYKTEGLVKAEFFRGQVFPCAHCYKRFESETNRAFHSVNNHKSDLPPRR